MRVLLVDVDSKIPNIALMKIATYHSGDEVELLRLGFSGYPGNRKKKVVSGWGYDVVYVSCIFTVNAGYFEVVGCDNVHIGGTGVDMYKKLPDEVDDCREDYSIYPDNDASYGFITRGCIRNCEFCFVPKKEGRLHLYRDWRSVVRHDKVYFLDNNFLAYDEHKRVLRELNLAGVRFQFNQGLDIRLVDDENSLLLAESRYIGEFIFAFDDVRYERMVERGLTLFQKYVPAPWKTKFFVYTHPDMPISDVIYRVEWLRNHESLPYIMRDKACWSSDNSDFYVDLAAYCNQPGLFKKLSWQEFLNKRHQNMERIEKSSRLYTEP